MASEIQEIQDAIHKLGAKWTATETEFIKTVDAEQRSHRLGVVLDKKHRLEGRRRSKSDAGAAAALIFDRCHIVAAFTIPPIDVEKPRW